MAASTNRLKFLIYGSRLEKTADGLIDVEHDRFEVQHAHLPSTISFLDFHGVAVYGGAFVKNVWHDHIGLRGPTYEIWEQDLRRRQQEAISLVRQGGLLILLVPPEKLAPGDMDLLPNILDMLGVRAVETPVIPTFDVEIPEFKDHMSRYGTARHRFKPTTELSNFRAITRDPLSAFVFADQTFVLPSIKPATFDDLTGICCSAFDAAAGYAARRAGTVPAWVSEFTFPKEERLEREASKLRQELEKLEASTSELRTLKGLLCWKGDVLAERVMALLTSLSLDIEVNEKCIEDGRLVDQNGAMYGVVEVKGVNRTIKRAMVGQVDAHRERQGLGPDAPAFLVVNTKANAESLGDKEEAIHPDIVAKAVSDKVLVMRTLDLLRFVALVQDDQAKPEQLRQHVDNSVGWLKVTSDGLELVGGER